VYYFPSYEIISNILNDPFENARYLKKESLYEIFNIFKGMFINN